MDNSWNLLVNIAYLSAFLGIAAVLKTKVKFFSKYIIPTSMLAGFLALIFGKEIIGLINFDTNILGNLVYHLMAIGFIALSLKDRKHNSKSNRDGVKTGAFIVSTYLIQGIVGFALTLLLANTLFPDLFPPSGLLLPLAYGQGPGQAYSIGTQWQEIGFKNGSNFGLTLATIGFLWACIFGVIIMNFLLRKVRTRKISMNNALVQEKLIEESDPGEIPLTAGLDKITIQLFLIGIVYLVTFLTIKGLNSVFMTLGSFGETIAQLLWGFHFIIGTLYAIVLRLIFDLLNKKKIIVNNYPNNYLLQRISGASFDYMIAASIAAISIIALKTYFIPLLLLSTIGGLLTIFYVIFIAKRLYKKHVLEYILGMYGMMTGTISTGLALLKEIDPKFNTQVAENLVLGSASGLFMGFPLMAILALPILGYEQNKPIIYLYTILAFIVYIAILYLYMYLSVKRRDKK